MRLCKLQPGALTGEFNAACNLKISSYGCRPQTIHNKFYLPCPSAVNKHHTTTMGIDGTMLDVKLVLA